MSRRINYKSPLKQACSPDDEIENMPICRDRQLQSKKKYKQERRSDRPYYQHYRGQSSGLQSIQNVMDSRAIAYSNKSNKSAETQQIAFLKSKLIETHAKLLEELQINAQKTTQIQRLNKQSAAKDEKIGYLQGQIDRLETDLDNVRREISYRVDRNQQKYRSVENRFHQQSRRNNQLKEDMECLRNKMLQAIMQKNMLQEANAQFKADNKRLQKALAELRSQTINYKGNLGQIESQHQALGRKYSEVVRKLEEKEKQISDMQRNLNELSSQHKEQQHILQLQRTKYQNLVEDNKEIQRQNSHWQSQVKQLEKIIQKLREEAHRHQNKKQTVYNNLSNEINKLNEQLESMQELYEQAQRQLSLLKSKPYQQAEKKRRHYEITKQFVNQLEKQQKQYTGTAEKTLSRNLSFKNNHTGSYAERYSPKNTPNALISKGVGYFQRENMRKSPQSRITQPTNATNANLSNNYEPEERRNKNFESINDIGELECALFHCNLERKKLKTQIDKIEESKIKTRDMVVRKTRLEEELLFQEQKIKKVKEQLEKLKPH